MAYEFKDTIVAELTSLGMEYNSNAHYEMADEVEEVYIKAKAWDKYLESTVRQGAIDEFGEGDPRVDYAVELTERLYREDK
ncbi:hypothetical protein MT414_13960 [Mammaliicoccus sciuri]|uniref:hypothetical protein n=1 Tax=Mammaliicoccus sciuri TaxID=1296 RepID=UPI001FB27482|nr:hypothetical protein [Mammaliicoccus sciuri]MCJ1763119.1 hypothetical protein [Mammaliicoccus sciuri]